MNKNRLGDITRIFRNAASVLTAFAALSGCAVIGNPDGGPFDETPPRITSTHPENGAIGVKTRKVSIDFDEFIKLENANEKVVISPPQKEQPEIKVMGKKIQVELFDSLKPNTTYSIDFADGIVDNNEGNQFGDYCFRFSTGDSIDTLEVSGYVLNAEDLEPVKGITVGLHSDLSDSAFTTKPFERVSRTDASGHFTVRGIAPGKYRIYAVMDMDQTFSYSQRSEMIAWMDSVIVPSSELRYREDTIFTADGLVDTTLLVSYTHYLPDDITLLAFQPEPVIQYLSETDRSTHEKFTLTFALPLDSMPDVKGLNFDDTDAYILQHSARYDTLTFWMKDTLVYYQDTLSISVTFMGTDTAGLLVPITDTLNLIPKKSRERILKDAAKKAEEDRKELERQIRRLERSGDSIRLAKLLEPKKSFLNFSVSTGNALNVLTTKITLNFKEPVSFNSDSTFHLYQKADTTWKEIPFEVEQDSNNILRYYVYGEWRPEETFRLTIDSAGIQGLYGLHNNKTEGTFKFSALNQYSTLTVNVSNPKPGYTVRLHNSSGKVERIGKLDNGSVDFFCLTPSVYYVSMFDDVNGNGKWDTGDYDEKRQPEGVWYIKRNWSLKQDWIHETDTWNILENPLTEQKPDELLKNKSSKKIVDIHKKNLERLEKKTEKKESEKNKKERKRKERKERREKNKEKYRERRARSKARKAQSDSDVSSPDPQKVTSPNQ